MKNIPLLFENDFCMVVDKPAGLAVQGGEGVGASLDSILSETFTERPLLVHRLDKDTSGLLLVAKNRDAAAVFGGLFSETSKKPEASRKGVKGLVKRYLALVRGIPFPPNGIIRLDLEMRGTAKKSETSYRVISGTKSDTASALEVPFSLLELELGTGRMHQIRRHLHLINHPVLGDDKYGDFALNKSLRKSHGLKRLLLHAFRLIVPPLEPILPEGLDISSPPPDYFTPFLDRLNEA